MNIKTVFLKGLSGLAGQQNNLPGVEITNGAIRDAALEDALLFGRDLLETFVLR
jgi:hypothetical protein